MEQTLITIKLDGLQRGLVRIVHVVSLLQCKLLGTILTILTIDAVGEIISRFEKKGFYLKGWKLVNAERTTVEKHYEDLSSMPFFTGLLDYMTSGPVVAMIWEGKNVVVAGRKMVRGASPVDSAPGTIRGDFAMDFAGM